MTWVVDLPEKPRVHRCEIPKGPSVESRKIGSVWECDLCYKQYELKWCKGYLGKLEKGLVGK
jgi:hypothetical protein